ncbi:MAG TPA: tetratricopeptide repeat protein, partial [Candidatus Polarisedimenticolia bacterium]|nr:tetratricopeptide repeat protein [Candidatus Polarisedimenticolia bacterium]
RRLQAALGAAAVVALLAASGAALLQARRARDERDSARRIAGMLVDMFSIARPGAGRDLTVKELLDRGASQLPALEGRPETRALLTRTLADLYEKSGHLSQASALYARIVEEERARGEDSLALAAAQHDLGRSLARQGEYARGADLFRRSLAVRRGRLGEWAPEVASSLNALALAQHELGRFQEAEPLYRRALEVDTVSQGEDHPHTTLVRGNLALLMLDAGRLAEAEGLYRIILAEVELEGDRPPAEGEGEQLAEVRDGLGLALSGQGRHDEALPFLRAAYKQRLSAFGAGHYLVARSMAHLGMAHLEAGSLDEARTLLETSERMRLDLLGETHMEYAESLHFSGRLHAALGSRQEAGRALERSAEVYRRALGPRHPRVAASLLDLAVLRGPGPRPGGCGPLEEARGILPSDDARLRRAQAALPACP